MDPDPNSEISPFSQYCLKSLSPLTAESSPGIKMNLDSPFICTNWLSVENRSLFAISTQDRQVLGRAPVCKCKKSSCLKLYCECFANGSFCVGCRCTDCKNTQDFIADRSESIAQITGRNPEAFTRTKTLNTRVCNCKKSGCQKKYCECFTNGMYCNADCKCEGCSNR